MLEQTINFANVIDDYKGQKTERLSGAAGIGAILGAGASLFKLRRKILNKWEKEKAKARMEGRPIPPRPNTSKGALMAILKGATGGLITGYAASKIPGVGKSLNDASASIHAGMNKLMSGSKLSSGKITNFTDVEYEIIDEYTLSYCDEEMFSDILPEFIEEMENFSKKNNNKNKSLEQKIKDEGLVKENKYNKKDAEMIGSNGSATALGVVGALGGGAWAGIKAYRAAMRKWKADRDLARERGEPDPEKPVLGDFIGDFAKGAIVGGTAGTLAGMTGIGRSVGNKLDEKLSDYGLTNHKKANRAATKIRKSNKDTWIDNKIDDAKNSLPVKAATALGKGTINAAKGIRNLNAKINGHKIANIINKAANTPESGSDDPYINYQTWIYHNPDIEDLMINEGIDMSKIKNYQTAKSAIKELSSKLGISSSQLGTPFNFSDERFQDIIDGLDYVNFGKFSDFLGAALSKANNLRSKAGKKIVDTWDIMANNAVSGAKELKSKTQDYIKNEVVPGAKNLGSKAKIKLNDALDYAADNIESKYNNSDFHKSKYRSKSSAINKTLEKGGNYGDDKLFYNKVMSKLVKKFGDKTMVKEAMKSLKKSGKVESTEDDITINRKIYTGSKVNEAVEELSKLMKRKISGYQAATKKANKKIEAEKGLDSRYNDIKKFIKNDSNFGAYGNALEKAIKEYRLELVKKNGKIIMEYESPDGQLKEYEIEGIDTREQKRKLINIVADMHSIETSKSKRSTAKKVKTNGKDNVTVKTKKNTKTGDNKSKILIPGTPEYNKANEELKKKNQYFFSEGLDIENIHFTYVDYTNNLLSKGITTELTEEQFSNIYRTEGGKLHLISLMME